MNVWRDRLDRWLSPVAMAVPLSPNAISTLALVLNLTAALVLCAARSDPRLFLVSIMIVTIGGLLDALDGIVARLKHLSSRFGDFLDHFFDRVSDLSLVAGWLIGAEVRIELALPVCIGVALNGYIGTQIEASFQERKYDTVGRGEFVLALVVYPILTYLIVTNQLDSWRFAGLRIVEWLAALLLLFGAFGLAQRFARAKRLGSTQPS